MLMDRVAMNPDLVLQFLFLFSSYFIVFTVLIERGWIKHGNFICDI